MQFLVTKAFGSRRCQRFEPGLSHNIYVRNTHWYLDSNIHAVAEVHSLSFNMPTY